MTISKHVLRAQRAIDAYQQNESPILADANDLADLISDLWHHAKHYKLDMSTALVEGHRHFRREEKEENKNA